MTTTQNAEEDRKWIFNRKPEDLATLADVEELIRKTYKAGIAYHLDESAEEIVGVTGAIEPGLRLFTDSEAKHMNALRDAMVAICDKTKVDVHEISLKEAQKRGMAPTPDDETVPESEQHVIDSMRDECVFCGATLVEADGRCPDRKAVEAGNLVAKNPALCADAIANAKAMEEQPDTIAEAIRRIAYVQELIGKDLLMEADAELEEALYALKEPINIVVEVKGGCADVTSCPPSITVEIIDHDNH